MDPLPLAPPSDDFGLSGFMPLFVVYAFFWGAVWGSFLNVVIWRLPRGMNLARPDSHCPHCGAAVRWHDNIPIVSWLLLRARCRDCSAPISARYPLVELLVALLSAALWWHVAAGRLDTVPIQVLLVPYLFLFFFMLICVAIAFIDLDLTIIPHSLTVGGIVLGLVAALLTPGASVLGTLHPHVGIVDSVVGLLAGAGIIFAVFRGYFALTGRAGIGGGDFVMMGMIGANLGWQSLLFVLLAASLQGLVAAVGASMLGARRSESADQEGFLKKGAWRPEFWDEDPEGSSTAHGSAETHAGLEPGTDSPAEGRTSAGEEPGNEGDVFGDTAGAGPAEGGPAEGGPSPVEEATVPHALPAGEGDAPPTGNEADEATEDDGFMQLAVPFGPFLALAAVQYIFFGRAFLAWLGAGTVPF